MKHIEFSIIVPAFNEEETIEKFLKNLQGVLSGIDSTYEIIVVDDGSTDDTFSIVSNIQEIRVIKHPYNKGNGAAVKTGILNAHGEKIVIIDADGQHDPQHIPDMLKLLGEYDLVVGARKSFGFGGRGFGNYFVSKLATYLSGIKIPDLTSGFRAFKKDKMLEFIDLMPNGFSLPSTSTLAFATSGYNVKFIPISANVRQGGKSGINILKDGMKFIVLIIRMVSLFKPLKVFVPISGILLFFGLLWSLRTFFMTKQISSLAAMILLIGIFVFLFGLFADQIAETRLSIGKMNKLLMQKKNEIIK
ncbi:MAG: glycosyltransferase family 2 protein [Candidatus Nitrosotenuis sp.]